MPGLRHNDARGLSLIEVVIAVGLVGVLAFGASKVLSLYSTTTEEVRQRGETADLRDFVRNSIDCTQTLAQPGFMAQCVPGGGAWVSLKNVAGDAFVAPPGARPTQIEDRQLRAKCHDLGGFYGITVDSRPVKGDGTPKKSALTGKTMDWSDLFHGIPYACAASCDMTVDFTLGADSRIRELMWGNAASTCPPFSYTGGQARIFCADNKGRSMRPNVPVCEPDNDNVHIHVELDVYTTAWADNYPIVGLWVGQDLLPSMWFTMLSDTVAIIQQAPITLRPLIAERWGTTPLVRSTYVTQPNRTYRLILDLVPGEQRFIMELGGVKVSDVTAHSSMGYGGKTINFSCGEAICFIDRFKLSIEPL